MGEIVVWLSLLSADTDNVYTLNVVISNNYYNELQLNNKFKFAVSYV